MDTNEIYKYIENKQFIITHEWRIRKNSHEPCGRPVVATVIGVDTKRGKFDCVMLDYDENVTCINKYNLPEYSDFNDTRKGALQFDIGKLDTKGSGRYLVTRFWEV